jgi:hypothetical protein
MAMALVLGANAVFAQKVTTDWDRTTPFPAVNTYFWVPTKPTPNELAHQRILAAIDAQLQQKGWSKVSEDQAQVALVSNVSTKEEKSLNTFYSGMGGGWGYGGWHGAGGGMGTSTTTVSTFTEGTLVLDMFDVSNKKLLWRGIATATISDKPEKNAKKIQKAAEKMFKNFPPTAKK